MTEERPKQHSRKRNEMSTLISLRPLTPTEALEGLLATPPPPKPAPRARAKKQKPAEKD